MRASELESSGARSEVSVSARIALTVDVECAHAVGVYSRLPAIHAVNWRGAFVNTRRDVTFNRDSDERTRSCKRSPSRD